MKIFYHSELDSTQEEAKRLIASGKITEASVIYADHQTHGRGSRGRDWESDKAGNLLATYVFPITKEWDIPHLGVYPLSLGIHTFLHEMLEASKREGAASLVVQIKWPNDLLINGKKICGALHEIETHLTARYFLAGIGVNIAWHPTNTLFPASHLSAHTNNVFEMASLVEKLGRHLEKSLQDWHRGGFKSILGRVRPYLYKLGEEITVYPARDKTQEMTGLFCDIDENGALVLETEKGVYHKITTGDIFPSLI